MSEATIENLAFPNQNSRESDRVGLALGSLSYYCSLVIPCKPNIMIGYINRVDNNGYVIEE